MFGGIPDFPAKFTCKRRFDNNASVAHYMKNVAPQQKSAKLPAKKEKKIINFSFWFSREIPVYKSSVRSNLAHQRTKFVLKVKRCNVRAE